MISHLKAVILQYFKRLFLPFIFLSGIVIRLLLPLKEGITQPFRTGGLFLEFARQIQNNGYRLPERIPFYTEGGIPFAYPPLPFYLEAFLIDHIPISEYIIGNLLPPIISILALFCFYRFVQELDLDKKTKQASLLAYAMMPVSFLEHIESAGLAEAFGSLALICFAFALARTCKKRTAGRYIFAGIMWAFCILCSPGSIYASILIVFIYVCLIFAREKNSTILQKTVSLVSCGAIAIALSSPYWLTVILNHGLDVFTGSFASQHGNFLLETVEKIAYFQVSRGNVYFLWDVMIFSGIMWAWSKRHYGLLAWFFIFFSIPRESIWLVALPASILAGMGMALVFGRLVTRKHFAQFSRTLFWAVFYLYVFLYPFWMIKIFNNAYQKGYWPAAIAGMQWADDNMPIDSKMIVLSNDQAREWVPHVSRRTVLNVHQGAEWEPDTYQNIIALNRELDNCHEFKCLEEILAKQTDSDNIYLLIDTARYRHYESIHCDERIVFNLLMQNDSIVIGQIISQ